MRSPLLIRIIIGALLFIGGLLINGEPVSIGLLLASYVIAGYGVLWSALKNIAKGQIFDENFLMSLATIGALALKQWDEAVAVMLFYLVGSLFEDMAVDKSRNSIADLMDIRPDYANLLKDGKEEMVDPYDVSIGDIILVKPGEKVPLDGVVLDGAGTLDTSALTGESFPREVLPGEKIISGCINISGLLRIRVTGLFEESTVFKILDMVENAGSKKAKMEKFITRFAKYYTPVVVGSAALLATLPPLIFGYSWSDWIYRSLLFLVISCPCALVISVPLSFFAGVGMAGKIGVLVKGSNYLEALASVNTVIFDKTGTLTTGTFGVTCVDGPDDLLELAAHAESYSPHPISQSIEDAYGKKIDKSRVEKVEEIPGKGLRANVDEKTIHVGNESLMKNLGIDQIPSDASSTQVYVAVDGAYYGTISLSDSLKPDGKQAISLLKNEGVKHTVMLTGDRSVIGELRARELGIERTYSQLLPEDKVKITEEIIENSCGKVAFAGDGINDAPVLARADIGIAMGGLGSQAAIEAADIVIMDDSPSKISVVMRLGKRTLGVAKQNVIFALTIKGIVLLLGALGMASMWAAVFADVGVAVLAILNSMRIFLMKNDIMAGKRLGMGGSKDERNIENFRNPQKCAKI